MPDLCPRWNYACAILGFWLTSKTYTYMYIAIQMPKEEKISIIVYRYV